MFGIKTAIKEKSMIISGIFHRNDFISEKSNKKIFHLNIPGYGNMGDQAIVYSTNKFFMKNYPEYKIIEIYNFDIRKKYFAIKNSLNKDDLIFIAGGGNLGSIWINEERNRRFIIEHFKNNKIISMPQTMSFSNDSNGYKELAKSKKIYCKNKNLILIAREKTSYINMKKNFTNKVLLNPDMVLSLYNTIEESSNRYGILVCLRSDREAVLSTKSELINELKAKHDNVCIYDTVVNRNVYLDKREEELFDMFNKFLSSEVVITDRLHGMVFAAITKTPCIVTKSLDHKVSGTYEWIKDLNYIRFVDDMSYEKIEYIINELINIKEKNTINSLEKYFSDLPKKILSN